MGIEEQTPTILIGTEEEPSIYLGTEANFTDLDKKNINENTKLRHTHDNKELLDDITQENIDNWNDKYTKEETDTKLTGKEDKSNKVNCLSGTWEDNFEETEKYPSMAVVANGFLSMQFNQIDPLKEQIQTVSDNMPDEIVIDDYVDGGSKDSPNPVSGKGVHPIWYDVEILKDKVTELEPMVKQAHIVRAFENYEALIDFYDAIYISDTHFFDTTYAGAAIMGLYTPIGSSMLIKTKNVPDLWVMDRVVTSTPEGEPFCADIKADAQAAGMTLDEYIVHKIDTEGEFSIKWLKFAQKETKIDLVNYPTKDEVIQPPTTANVGQTIVVKEVDESGKPTKWEAVDVGSGATEEKWELLQSKDITEEDGEVVELIITFPEGYKEYVVSVKRTEPTTASNTLIYSNVLNIEGHAYHPMGVPVFEYYEVDKSSHYELRFSSMMLEQNNAIKLDGYVYVENQKNKGQLQTVKTTGWIEKDIVDKPIKRWHSVRFATRLNVGSKYRVWGCK